ncbi:hypothetical protein [Agrococcus sp. Marseille-Q4369]|uniref:hypothetical protein n=1 Tax=Agrococcus sp. Marseille-Q4369 TaxID=2810513 RepID=UPI001B8CA79F|nr:hypothetical protein [Agrococcus sp. Marseille-Q4369]QUW19833.1 hypothetical protein JSQ78_06010 [Agrococcus sp. Marseille-Q4369]
MPPTTTPGALRRVLRSRLTTASTALLALSLLASAGTGAGASAQLQHTLDANWRGLYDLLVTAPGTEAELDGLIAPTALASLGSRMTLRNLDAVRAVDGVAVAAPLGTMVVAGGGSTSRLQFAVPLDASKVEPDPQSYRVTLTYTSHDGIGERIVNREVLGVVVDDADLPLERELTAAELAERGQTSCNINGIDFALDHPASAVCRTEQRQPIGVSMSNGSGMSGAEIVDGFAVGYIDGQPATPPTALLIDPVAEQALLGESGAFLAPLVALAGTEQTDESLLALAETAPTRRLEHLRAVHEQWERALAEHEAENELVRRALEEAGAGATMGEVEPQPVVPVLVSPQRPGSLTLTVTVEGGFPAPTTEFGWTTVTPEVFGDAPGTLVHEASADVSLLLDPVSDGSGIVLPLLGDGPVPDFTSIGYPPSPQLHPMGVAIPESLPFTERGDGIALTAEEYLRVRQDWHDHDPTRDPFRPADNGTVPGAEAMYRLLDDQVTGGMTAMLPTLVPIDDFDASAIAVDDSSLGYAPLGSFDTVDTTLVADGDGAALEPVELAPSVTGFGFASAVPTIVADVANAPRLRVTDPISSIRVKVEGVDGGYSPENVARVTAVAQSLVDAGFTVTMAAGSSRQDVGVFLDGYAFGVTDASATQTVGPLGTVRQQWPSLGAAQRVEGAVAGATTGVLALAVGAATLLFGVVQFAGIAPRRRDAALLSRLGWRRSRVLRRFAAEDALVLGVLAVAASGAIALMATQTVGRVHESTPMIVGAAVLTALVLAAAALTASVPRSRVVSAAPRALRGGRHAAAPRARLLARSTVGFGIGQASLHPGHAITVALAIALIGLATAGAWLVVEQGIAAAGATLLANAATLQSIGVQALLAAIGVVSGVVLVVLARRLDARVRAGQWRALGAMGWSSRRIWAARAVELVTVAVPAIAIAAALGWFGAALVDGAEPRTVTLIAGGAAAAALLLLLALQRTASKGRA